MMIAKIKFGKIAIVIFLTVLIWVWADLALDELFPVSNVPITISKSTNRALWVSFVDENESLVPVYTVKSIVLKGSASRTSEVDRKLKTGLLQLDFFLDAEQEGMDKPGKYPLDVLNLLRKSNQIRELGLAVQSCEPNKLTINVVELVKKSLEIKCFNESGTALEVESIEPSPKVDMFVLADSRLEIPVQLTPGDIKQARSSGVEKTPYVVLAPGQTRQAPKSVKIKMLPEADSLTEHTIQDAKLGITLGMNLVGEYKVEVNYNEVVSPFPILATVEAKNAYENQVFQIYLIIPDDYAKKPNEEQRIEVVYNFPEEFVRKNEIRLKNPQQTAVAKFKLIRLTSAPAPPSGPD